MRNKYVCCGLLLVLAACSGSSVPAYHATQYTLPPTPGGRLCVQARDYCKQSCDLDYRACYNDVQTAAQHNYDRYTNDHFADPKAVKMLPSQFEHPEACNAEKKTCIASCVRPYDACYSSCGGNVTVTSSCQFLCFE